MNGFADRSTEILLCNAWTQFRDYQISYIVPHRQFADGHSVWRAKSLNNLYVPCWPQCKKSIHLNYWAWGEGEVWLKTPPQVNREKKFCLVPPTFPSSCAILDLLAVLLDCREEYLKAKSFGLVMTLCFDISSCGKSGLRLFWSIRVQSPREVRTQLRQSRRDLPWWADLILQGPGNCVGRGSWLHVRKSVYSTWRFLGSCFLSDNNKNNFRLFSSGLF